MAFRAPARPDSGDKAEPWTWSWLKEWTGYFVTILPYVSAALVTIPNIPLAWKLGILALFAILVLTIRVLHEKAGIEVTSPAEKEKRPR